MTSAALLGDPTQPTRSLPILEGAARAVAPVVVPLLGQTRGDAPHVAADVLQRSIARRTDQRWRHDRRGPGLEAAMSVDHESASRRRRLPEGADELELRHRRTGRYRMSAVTARPRVIASEPHSLQKRSRRARRADDAVRSR